MICELCGRQFNAGVRLEVEGSIVSACENCQNCGKVVSSISSVKEKPKPVEFKPSVVELQDLEEEETLADDFGERIKKVREKRNLKQSDLAKLLNEPESIVHRLESGRFEPDEELVNKLEKKLNIRLMVKTEGAPRLVGRAGGKEVTLGDVVVVKKRGER